MPDARPRLTAFSHGAGCACKLGPTDLAQILAPFGAATHPDLVVGTEWGDDAAVWRRPDGCLSIATIDFFTPIVDDPRHWGAIAAANAASDVYAMGGTPLFALNVVAWPRDQLSLDLLGDVLQGARDVAEAGGWLIVGGHSVDSAEPLFGQAVMGETSPERLLTNAGGRAGDVLVLTKALGTGLVATAVKRSDPAELSAGGALEQAYPAALASMTTLNADAARVALSASASAATDVTGFGLLGHLHKLALASGVEARVHVGAVPRLPGVDELLAAGQVPGGTGRNQAFVRPYLEPAVARALDRPPGCLPGIGAPAADSLDEAGWSAVLALLADPQTSGGLLFACPPERAPDAVAELRVGGHPAAVVGELLGGEPGRLILG
jgi:selenide, water dikinase